MIYYKKKSVSSNGSSGWDKLSEKRTVDEIDCKKEMFQSISLVYFDTDGKELYSDSYDTSEWTRISPDTTMDKLRKIVCKFPKLKGSR
jgi:hypothetical protein